MNQSTPGKSAQRENFSVRHANCSRLLGWMRFFYVLSAGFGCCLRDQLDITKPNKFQLGTPLAFDLKSLPKCSLPDARVGGVRTLARLKEWEFHS